MSVEPASGQSEAPLPNGPPRTREFGVSCVMPAFNEEESIELAVAHVRSALRRLGVEFEVIVVDDGSTDQTGKRLDELAANSEVHVVRSEQNRGYGWALRAGCAVATLPLVFFIDSDDQFDPMDLRFLLQLIDDADIVAGQRVPRGEGKLRAIVSRGYNALVYAIFRVRVPDINCAFKLMRREVVSQLGLVSDGYVINAEMMARAMRMGLRVRTVPVSHRQRAAGRSKVGFRDVPWSLAQLFSLWRTLREMPPADSSLPR